LDGAVLRAVTSEKWQVTRQAGCAVPRGDTPLAAAGAVLLNLAWAEIDVDVNVRALTVTGREFGYLTEACDCVE
jgi:hypothetical protein